MRVAFAGPVGHEQGESRALLADLLASLQSMVAAGHRPDDYLLVRLTDGRTKASVLSAGMSAADVLDRMRNEHGPVASAVHASVADLPVGTVLRVADLTSPGLLLREQRVRWRNGLLEFSEPVWVSVSEASYSRDLRNSAILAGSLGMTTGWLPKVDASLSPEGVLS